MRLILLALMVSACASALASDFTSLEEQMNGREFQEAGLHKLSADELAALNAYIRERNLLPDSEGAPAEARTSGGEVLPPSVDLRGFENRETPDAIVSRIKGRFRGWQGNGTRFELENGQVWEQMDSETFAIDVDNPTVTIRNFAFGTWRLKVDGYNNQIRVRRIK